MAAARRHRSKAPAGRLLLLCLASTLVALLGCSGNSDNTPPNNVSGGFVASDRTRPVEFLTFGTVSSYLEDAPLVIRPHRYIEVIAAGDIEDWMRQAEVPEAVTHPDSIGAFYRERDRLSSGSFRPPWVRTGERGSANQPLSPGRYLICPVFGVGSIEMVAGCDHVTVSDETTVYVFFDEGRAFIDTGDGPAADAYRRLSCPQQRRLGQRPDDLVHLGGNRYRCSNQF